jgi:CLIP-associating protein 1/2
VDALEDSDAHVRDCARTSVVELFSGPGVTDAARADLKKEMTKKGVRKTIIDSVLSKLLSVSTSGSNSGVRSGAVTPVGGGGHSEFGSEAGDATPLAASTTTAPGKGYMPPSLTLAARRPQGATSTLASSTSSTSTTPTTAMSRSVSTKAELSRPPSRTAASTPSLPPETPGAGPSSDVEPVYVRCQSSANIN